MHVVSLLKSLMLDVQIEAQPAVIADVFPDWKAHDGSGW